MIVIACSAERVGARLEAPAHRRLPIIADVTCFTIIASAVRIRVAGEVPPIVTAELRAALEGICFISRAKSRSTRAIAHSVADVRAGANELRIANTAGDTCKGFRAAAWYLVRVAAV